MRTTALLLLIAFATPAFAADEVPARTAEQVIEASLMNDAEVEENYLQKRLQVTGLVSRIKRVESTDKQDETGYILEIGGLPGSYEPPLTRRPGEDPSSILFRFSAKGRKELAALRFGQTVTVEGLCIGRGSKDDERPIVSFAEARVIKVHERSELPRSAPYDPYAVDRHSLTPQTESSPPRVNIPGRTLPPPRPMGRY